ncbi:MAG: ferredoxin family protein [Pseudoramibacter sp.]
MSIAIKENQCIGCGRCVEACPGNLIKLNAEGKAEQRHPKDCWGCTACLKACPAGAVAFFLGADIGGRGATLSYKKQGDDVRWTVTRRDGSSEVINLNQKDANQY